MRQVSDEIKKVESSGYLLPWDKEGNQPCLIKIEDVEFIAVFSTEEKMKAHLELVKYDFEVSTKIITDTDEFLESVQPKSPMLPFIRVALNPWITERNTTRFTELKFRQ